MSCAPQLASVLPHSASWLRRRRGGPGRSVSRGQAHAPAATLLSQGKTATASSLENSSFPASAAVDGNTGTRWSSSFSDPQWLEVDLGASATISQVVLNWEAAYATAFQIQTSADGTNWTTIYSTTTGTGGTQTLNVTGTGRYIRMYGTARATPYGYCLWEFQVYGTTSGTGTRCSTTDAALNQPATASSLESSAYPASKAVDGNTGTRWSSSFSDPQWLQVDLGSSQTICEVTLDWEAAYATAFQIQASADGTNWTTIYSTTTGTGGTQTLTRHGTGRYVRMYGTARATPYGYRLWEFGVYTTGRQAAPRPPRRRRRPPRPPAPRPRRSGVTPAPSPRRPRCWNVDRQPDQRPVPRQPGLLELQRPGRVDRAAAVHRHAGQSAGRMYFYLGSPNSAVLRLHRVHRGRIVDQCGHYAGGPVRPQAGPAAARQRRVQPGGRRELRHLPGEPHRHLPAVRELGADRIQGTGHGQRTLRHPVARATTRRSSQAARTRTTSPATRPRRATPPIPPRRSSAAAEPSRPIPPLCAGLNRHVAQLPTAEQSNPANFYQAAPANYYAQFWHQNAINGLQYGFPYDDDAGQSSDISITNPQYLVVAVGW